MRIIKNLSSKRKVDIGSSRDKRSFLLMESLARRKLSYSHVAPIKWSPVTVMEYVEQSSPCATLNDDVRAYSEYIRSNPSARLIA